MKIQRVERQPSPIILFHAPLFFPFLRVGARGNLRYFFERRVNEGEQTGRRKVTAAFKPFLFFPIAVAVTREAWTNNSITRIVGKLPLSRERWGKRGGKRRCRACLASRVKETEGTHSLSTYRDNLLADDPSIFPSFLPFFLPFFFRIFFFYTARLRSKNDN